MTPLFIGKHTETARRVRLSKGHVRTDRDPDHDTSPFDPGSMWSERVSLTRNPDPELQSEGCGPGYDRYLDP